METIVNKVAESGLITLNLEQFLPDNDAMASLDLAPFLFKGMILREKDFRAALLEQDWKLFEHKHVAVFCSADAIIPMWAYMLLGSYLSKVNAKSYFVSLDELKEQVMLQSIASLDLNRYQDARVVVKGCGDIALPESAFLAIAEILSPVVKSLMYGEPCSTVPIYKKK